MHAHIDSTNPTYPKTVYVVILGNARACINMAISLISKVSVLFERLSVAIVVD
jgi:hypothetical protein